MKIVKVLVTTVMVYLALPAFAQDQAPEQAPQQATQTAPVSTPAFITDELYVFTHAGPGKNYRILGRLASGSEIKLTGTSENDFSQFIDDRNRAVWVENQYLSKSPGIRFAIAELNGRHANLSETNTQLASELEELRAQILTLENQKQAQEQALTETKSLLTATKAKLRDEDTNIKKQWFYNGAAVLAVGLILGLILPRLAGRRRHANTWK